MFARRLFWKGEQQMRELGELFRATYIDKHHLVDPIFNPRQVYIRSSASQRTIESALGVMYGMFGPQFIPKDAQFAVHMKSRSQGTLRRPSKRSHSPENMYARSSCKRLWYLRQLIKQSSEWSNREKTSAPFRAQLRSLFNAKEEFPSR
jgi:hypothetical protein